MAARNEVGIEQARADLPSLVASAGKGKVSVVTRHGKPCAAIVPLAMAARRKSGGLLDLRGTAKGLWAGAHSVRSLREEWE